MRATVLDTQISVDKRVSPVARNSYNEEIVEWEPLAPAPGSPVVGYRWWAEVQDVLPSRAESVRNGLEVVKKQTRIRMRYRNDIDASMRVTVHRDTDVVYRIVSDPVMVNSAGRKREIEFMCELFSTAGRES